MNDAELQARLLAADSSGAPPTVPPEFGERVRRLSARRKRRTALLCAHAALCLMAAAAFALLRPSRPAPEVVAQPAVEDYAAQLAALRQAAGDAQAVADAIRSRRKLAAQRAEAEATRAAADPLFEIKLQVEMTAARRFAEAERSAAQGDLPGAASSYERVVTLFPDSRVSALAQERLAHLKMN